MYDTYERWQAREEEIERQQERRDRAADLRSEYPIENWVEVAEFASAKPVRAERMQAELDFEGAA